jgi:hypothetical protein
VRAEQMPVKRLLFILPAFVLALAAVQPAAADSRTVRDARGDFKGSHWPGPGSVWAESGPCAGSWVHEDTPETCSPDAVYFENLGVLLDIASVAHGHKARLVRHRLETHRTWKKSLLSRSEGGQISFYLSTNRDAAFERRIDIVVRSGKLTGVIRNRSGRVLGRVAATRPNAKTVQVAFARRFLGRRVASYRWFAFAGIHCKRKYDLCGDRSPAAALVPHRL